MKQITNNKLLLKILSGIIAVILWTAITYTEDPLIAQTLNGIDIKFEGESELHSNGLIITNKKNLPDISVTIRGNRSSVISSMDMITASADVSGIKEAGSNSVEVKYNYPTSSVTLAKTKTREITLETEKIVSRNIPVKLEIENQERNSQYIIEASCVEDTVRVRGAESTVYKIEYAEAIVDVTNITKTGSQEYMYKFYDNKKNIVAQENIIYRSSETVTVETAAYRKVSLPVKVVLEENLQENYGITVKSLSVPTVDAGVPENIDISEIEAVIRPGSASDGTQEVKLSVPEGVYIPEKYSTVTVNYQLVPKVLQEFEVPVTVKNLPEGKSALITPQKITVSVKGIQADIFSEKITAEIDAEELSEENTTVPVTIEAGENVKIIGSYSVIGSIK